tara:strand:+ start:45 stop:662 length:618 start_codon:yes stop_codon:yes gene_type:complete
MSKKNIQNYIDEFCEEDGTLDNDKLENDYKKMLLKTWNKGRTYTDENDAKREFFEKHKLYCGYFWTYKHDQLCFFYSNTIPIKNKYGQLHFPSEEEQEDYDIVFHCASCSRPIIRNSLDHDFATCDNDDNWFCVNCPQKTCDDCVLGQVEGYEKCVLCDGYFAEDDDYSENIEEEDASCHLCGSKHQLVQMKSTGEIICQKACDE